MNHPKALKFNEQYLEFGKYDSIENIPTELRLITNKKRGWYFLAGGLILLSLGLILSLTFDSISNTYSIFSLMGAFICLAGSVFTFVSRKVIELKQETIQIKNQTVQWQDITSISKTSFQAFGGLTFKNLIIEYSDTSRLEFTYNFLNHSSADVEQLIYLFWERGRK